MLLARLLILLASLAALVGLAAAPSHASSRPVVPALEVYVGVYGYGVCADIDADPTIAGFAQSGNNLTIKAPELSNWSVGYVVGNSVIELCPRHLLLMNAVINGGTVA